MLKRLDDILKRYQYLSAQLADPETIADMGAWQKYSKEQADLKDAAEKYLEYLSCEKEMKEAFAGAETEEDAEMRRLFSDEGYACKERLGKLEEELKILLLPKDKNDERSCILEIRAGAGGEEAALFAAELCRMYQNYCAAHRLKTEALDVSETELGGVKEAVYNVSGKGAYKRLKYESGVHRVQRVPETETQGRIHTVLVPKFILTEEKATVLLKALNRQANVIESLKYGIWYSVSLTVTETVTMLKWKPRILIPVWGLKDLLVQFRELIICSRLTQSRI